jgi:hypothetical protein
MLFATTSLKPEHSSLMCFRRSRQLPMEHWHTQLLICPDVVKTECGPA